MLNKIKLLFWLFIVAVVAYFVSQNAQEHISVKLINEYKTSEYPVGLVLVISMLVGGFIVWIFMFADFIQQRLEKRKLKKYILNLESELEKCKRENNDLKKKIKDIKGPLYSEEHEEKEIEIKEEKKTGEVEESGTLRQGLHEGKTEEDKSSEK